MTIVTVGIDLAKVFAAHHVSPIALRAGAVSTLPQTPPLIVQTMSRHQLMIIKSLEPKREIFGQVEVPVLTDGN